jgi:choice-of-anchor A domain-containing protein
VILDFANGLNLGGDITLTGGLTPDMVLWNFGGTANVQLNNNASSYPTKFFQGIILAPNNAISIVNANLNGRVFGGDSSDMQIVSGDTINAPPPSQVPEPSSMLLLGTGLIGGASIVRRKFAK